MTTASHVSEARHGAPAPDRRLSVTGVRTERELSFVKGMAFAVPNTGNKNYKVGAGFRARMTTTRN
jgi:hypothetical protein